MIVDGIIGPWFLEPWIKTAQDNYEVHYIILRASKEKTMNRAIERSKLNKDTNTEIVEIMWEQFDNLGNYEANIIDTTDDSIEETVSKVKDNIKKKGHLLI